MIPDAFEAIGTQLSLPISVVLLAVGVALAVLSVLKYRQGNADRYGPAEDGWFWSSVLWITVAGVSAIVLGAASWGWAPRYWTAYRVGGTITSVSATLDGTNNEVTVGPVITLDTVDVPMELDDPRAMALEGSEVELTCYVWWHTRAADSYHCQIAAIR